MSRYQRNRLLNTTELLAEAMIKLQSVTVEEVPAILMSMQDVAVAMGELVEQLKGEGTKSVSELEALCENLYQVSVEVAETGAVGDTIISLGQSVVNLRDALVEEFPDQKEVVYLPYNASMWDSLESVWKKADADPNTEAYVVPIPYYEKNSDGKLESYHYEGGQYPKDVPVTDYHNFDLRLRHPDEIYIHNPYDDWNNVTSVDPDFYSSRIRNYTEKLTYIPYFVLGEIDPNREKLGKVADFARMPGVLNSHQVIVQSENMRLCYIRALVEQFGEETRASWEKKIVAGGSPKFDKILSVNKEEIEIPEEWKKYIYRADGTKKKVVLYNTSVDAFVKSDGRMVAKIQTALKTFYENKADVTLLWRPHPLMEQTISSMMPEVWNEYICIVNEYRESDWGIYDDSSDMNRAILISDAYYGDRSSLVQLCQKVEMPVMIQNVNIK